MNSSINTLQLLHPHFRDSLCTFDPVRGYIQTIQGQPYRGNYNSVTKWIATLFPVFDADLIIYKMMRGKNWNSLHKYWGMTPDQIKLLEGHANIGKKIENVDKILTKVGSGLLQKAIQEHQIKGLTKMNPKAEALLEDISGKQLTEEQVKKMMKEAGVNTAAEQAKFLERKQALELLSNALHVFGLGKITHIL